MITPAERARELMLNPKETRLYVAIYESAYGTCPDCRMLVGKYETAVCTHVRTCKGGSK